jgi:hypothetical protein
MRHDVVDRVLEVAQLDDSEALLFQDDRRHRKRSTA